MAKLPAFAKAFAGRWRIVEMDVWDKDFCELDHHSSELNRRHFCYNVKCIKESTL